MSYRVIFKQSFWQSRMWISLVALLTIMTLLWLFWYDGFREEWNHWLIWVLFLVSAVWTIYRALSFTILEEGIELRNPITAFVDRVIPNDAILQVRYEDEFDNFFSGKYIIVYLKEPLLRRGKHRDRLRLYLSGPWSYNSIRIILQHFMEIGKDVKIMTSNRKIKRSLGIENWDKVNIEKP